MVNVTRICRPTLSIDKNWLSENENYIETESKT
jgi:hypothetical protein